MRAHRYRGHRLAMNYILVTGQQIRTGAAICVTNVHPEQARWRLGHAYRQSLCAFAAPLIGSVDRTRAPVRRYFTARSKGEDYGSLDSIAPASRAPNVCKNRDSFAETARGRGGRWFMPNPLPGPRG